MAGQRALERQMTDLSDAVDADTAERIAQFWVEVRGRLKTELGDSVFNSWIRPLGLGGLRGSCILLRAPSRFMRDHISSHYHDRLLAHWRHSSRAISALELEVGPATPPPPQPASPGGVTVQAPVSSRTAQEPVVPPVLQAPQRSPRRDPAIDDQAEPHLLHAAAEPREEGACAERDLHAPLDNRFTFDNFVQGKSNELALAAARRVAEGQEVKFNPLYLYGGVGLGKTHLMHAIAWHIRTHHPSRRVIYITAEKFMYQFIRALRHKDTMSFKQQFRETDVLMVDDVQFLADKDATQEEFFHTFNALVDHQRQVVISADRSPSDLKGIEDRIRSRLGWGLVADIHQTDYELRLAVLETKLAAQSRAIAPEITEFLARRISSNIRDLEGALTRVLAHADLVGRQITLDMVRDVLADLLRANAPKQVTIEEIQRRVAEFYSIRMMDMTSSRRARVVARPRQVAMYLSKQLTSRSLPEIGRKFGNRDHTTVMHACTRIQELSETDTAFGADVEMLRRSLES
ncbi:chromosomal replication initiator protein DnaA [Zavarzinia sp. CC-PAN008]|uniref:chromosomal replication initiator protein DnaA n=1 Tax=Zavarzinia sp. CC-PAN008 TaxID=3243332 RepID=UPI003F74A157